MAVSPYGCEFLWLAMQGTVLIKNAEELQNYSQGEEDRMEQVIRAIADS